MTDVVWLVGRAGEIGALETKVDPLDAAVEESWPTGVNAEVVVLVRAEPDAAADAARALGASAQRFDDEAAARDAVREIVTSD